MAGATMVGELERPEKPTQYNGVLDDVFETDDDAEDFADILAAEKSREAAGP